MSSLTHSFAMLVASVFHILSKLKTIGPYNFWHAAKKTPQRVRVHQIPQYAKYTQYQLK